MPGAGGLWLVAPARRRPQLAAAHVRHCGQFAHVEGELAAGESIRLMRLHYGGSVTTWGV
ncbi:hypothetical protein [Streptomyces sp. NBC_00986]|uniref:hypothetical protein n=1 Tax=Streptomyces sp. NBC_00986 TaxID=2903702 RepID=UPI00387061F2|nr:hypothetical protein OG504_31220 [Streptomyces sp. NBC_00986]